MSKLLQEFKEFAMRGNVVDMAIGVIVGGAFGKIVTSLVNDVIMPPIGVLTGGVDFTNLKYIIQQAAVDPLTQELVTPEVAVSYGSFIQTIVDFLIIAICIFFAIKVMVRITNNKKKEEAAIAQPAQPSAEEKLLSEIRDILKNK